MPQTKKFNEPSVVLPKRVPESKKQEISDRFEVILDEYRIIKQIQDNNLTRSEKEALKSTKNK